MTLGISDLSSRPVKRTQGSSPRARQFSSSDFNDFDLIYAMDQSNYNSIIRLADSNEDIAKVKLILEENNTIENKNVPDPYYGDLKDFEYVFELLHRTCEIITGKLK